MSGLFVERVHVVTAGLAVAVAYLISPVAAYSATCDVMPKSFDCMSGQQKTVEGTKTDATKEVQVASIAPADIASDADWGAGEEADTPRRTGRKAGMSGRRSQGARSASARRQRSSGSSEQQTARNGWRTRSVGYQARGGVVTSCFPARLRGLLSQVASHYGKTPVITSGYRSPSHNRRIGGAKESQHMSCTAADFFIPGVNPFSLASYLKSLSGRGGVGTYCGNRTVHLDVGQRREWHWGCGGRGRYASRRHRGGRYVSRVMQRYAAARNRG